MYHHLSLELEARRQRSLLLGRLLRRLAGFLYARTSRKEPVHAARSHCAA